MNSKQRAWILFGIAGVLLIALFTRNWISSDDGGLGLTGMKRCMANGCEGRLWFSLPHVPASILLVSTLGMIAGALAIFLLAHAGAMVLQNRAQEVQPNRVNGALAITMIVGAIFMIRIFSEKHSGLHVGWSSIVTLLACIGGLAANIKLVEPLRTASAAAMAVQAYSVGAAPAFATAPGQPIRAFPISMQLGMTRFHGHMFLVPGRVYFLCVKQGGAWLAAAGAALGGAVGGALVGLATSGVAGAPQIYDEATLHQYAAQMPGSVVWEPRQIESIKQTIWMRVIRANGQRYGLPHGLGNDLKAAIGPWARHHSVKTIGFA